MDNEQIQNKNKPLVLVIDDNPNNIQAVGANLIRHNIGLSMASDANKALTAMYTKKPDLILLDIMMPEIDGYQLAKIIKNDPELKDIPIIFLTAKTSQEDILEGFESGAVDYITKPFNPMELISRVNAHLQIKEYQNTINEKNKILEKLNNEMGELIGITAHDLKNPIYNILLLAKAMKEEKLSKSEINEFVDDIEKTSERMLELIKNILDVNALEQGKLLTHIEPINIVPLTEQLIDTYNETAKPKNIKIHFEKNDFNKLIMSDENLFVQSLDNLISNAVKYSPKGKNVYVRLSYDNQFAYISVKDEGPGLSTDDKNKAFQKFSRLTPIPTGGESSTGLGLSIVKKYIELMKGEIILESALGEGSDFIIKLPLHII